MRWAGGVPPLRLLRVQGRARDADAHPAHLQAPGRAQVPRGPALKEEPAHDRAAGAAVLPVPLLIRVANLAELGMGHWAGSHGIAWATRQAALTLAGS